MTKRKSGKNWKDDCPFFFVVFVVSVGSLVVQAKTFDIGT